MKSHHSFVELGEQLANGWGIDGDLAATIQSLKPERELVCLVASLLKQIQGLRNDVRSLPKKLAKELKADFYASELEKQKTADAQQRAAEAQAEAAAASLPCNVTVIQMRPEEIEKAVGNRRVLRRF